MTKCIFKKALCFCFTLIITCSLFGCSNSDSTAQNSTSSSGDSAAASTEESGALSLITDPYGGLFRNGAATETGYYEIMNTQPDYINVLYTDYQTLTRTYLCSSPECLHNDDTCNSWLPTMGQTYLFASQAQNKIYLVSCGVASDGTASDTAAVTGRIFEFDPSGANRRVLYQLQSNEQFSGTAAGNNTKLYTGVQVVNYETGKMTLEIREIDLKTGESKTIYTTENTGERIFGAYGDCLVLEELGETARSYVSLNVVSGEKSAPQYSYDYTQEVRTELVDGNFVYSLRSDELPNCSLYQVDLTSGAEQKVAESIAIYDVDPTRISGVFDNHIEIETSDNRNPEDIKPIKYIIDTTSGTCSVSNLKYESLGTTKDIYILAQGGDRFLVRNSVKQAPITITDQMGVPTTLEAAFPQYALISKSDYWNNVANYQAISDTF